MWVNKARRLTSSSESTLLTASPRLCGREEPLLTGGAPEAHRGKYVRVSRLASPRLVVVRVHGLTVVYVCACVWGGLFGLIMLDGGQGCVHGFCFFPPEMFQKN